MATVWRTRKNDGIGDDERTPMLTREAWGKEAEECVFCGEPCATGWWMAIPRPIAVCQSCAVRDFAQLFADTMIGENGTRPDAMQRLRDALKAFELTFWRACTSMISRQVAGEKERQAHEDR